MISSSNPQFWRKQAQLPFLQRIAAAPAEVIDYVKQVNARESGSAIEPALNPALTPSINQTDHVSSLNSALLTDIRSAIAELPEQVKAKLEPKLLGVFLATGVGSSAITDVISDTDGNMLGAIVLLDSDAFLSRTANSWMAWKESSPFNTSAEYTLLANIAEPEQDQRKQALQYLLLHEFGHVLSMNTTYLPNWWIGSQKFKDTEEYSFLSICWQIAMSGEIIPLIRHNFEHRSGITYYGQAQLNASQMLAIYQALSGTGFSTLYAATTVYEDFAESFATYVHVVLMGKPWCIQICYREQTIFSFSDYWASPRSQQKAKIFEQLFCS
ncbi:hypothetical protein H8K33_16510 [Undibacterium amnicola]|uniref:Uncharacterized protein n=1 Tax=Undibacterium amnicola TaxID=1834038 RepID=A0ABR6XUE6_9BURK|nr:hypothetical protein [Undibacterium amnicola]MBC3833113.1 hypothetical protein [Undibacterium amnicola]